ncbi:MAG: hypothetical protein FJ368_02165 [Pelagibacterales bacterium]|nr:hypothetical protein [Pelagibacterales bacterium]
MKQNLVLEKEVIDFFNQLKSTNTDYDFAAAVEKNPSIVDAVDNNGNNVLHYVVLGGKSLRLAMLLCAKGADIDKANIIVNTPLHLSVMNQRNEMIAFFCSRNKKYKCCQ